MPEQPEPHHHRREVQDEDAGRQRLASTLRHGSRAQVVVAVLLAVLGFATVVQVRNTGQDNTYAGLREQDLIEILNALTGTAERARRERDRLEQTRDELQSAPTPAARPRCPRPRSAPSPGHPGRRSSR